MLMMMKDKKQKKDLSDERFYGTNDFFSWHVLFVTFFS